MHRSAATLCFLSLTLVCCAHTQPSDASPPSAAQCDLRFLEGCWNSSSLREDFVRRGEQLGGVSLRFTPSLDWDLPEGRQVASVDVFQVEGVQPPVLVINPQGLREVFAVERCTSQSVTFQRTDGVYALQYERTEGGLVRTQIGGFPPQRGDDDPPQSVWMMSAVDCDSLE